MKLEPVDRTVELRSVTFPLFHIHYLHYLKYHFSLANIILLSSAWVVKTDTWVGDSNLNIQCN